MGRPRVSAGGGFAAIRYSLRKGREAGGMLRLYGRLRSRNACKTCAFGMGGQRGGMVNEAGGFPREVTICACANGLTRHRMSTQTDEELGA